MTHPLAPPAVLEAMLNAYYAPDGYPIRDDAMEAALRAAKEMGWVLVPIEPTEKMLIAAGKNPSGVMLRGGVDWLGKMLPKYWSAMLAASHEEGR